MSEWFKLNSQSMKTVLITHKINYCKTADSKSLYEAMYKVHSFIKLFMKLCTLPGQSGTVFCIEDCFSAVFLSRDSPPPLLTHAHSFPLVVNKAQRMCVLRQQHHMHSSIMAEDCPMSEEITE